MIGTIQTNNKGEKISPLSAYNPPKAVRDLTVLIKQDFAVGVYNWERTYAEYNNKNLQEVIDESKKRFNLYYEDNNLDPALKWKSKTTRPITRNKIISIAAHLTTYLLFPNYFAQNQDDEEDKACAEAMRLMVEYNIRHSDYDTTMLFGVISMLVNPALIVEVEFAELLTKCREMTKNGVEIKEVIDEFFSGFQMHIVPLQELLIANPNVYDIQKQRFLFRRKLIDFATAKAKYKDHPNFIHIRPGIKAVYDEATDMFYDITDEENPTLCEEAVYYNRQDDMEVPFINGVYMGESNVEANLIKHRRLVLQNEKVYYIPVYKFAKSGAYPINDKDFFYYKSVADVLGQEQDLIDKMYRMVMDGTFLDIFPALVNTGKAKINSNVIVPGAIANLKGDGEVKRIETGSNLNSGYAALQKLEESITESTQSNIRGGISETGDKTAWEVSRMELNAKIQLGILAKMIARLVVDIGYLMTDIIIMHQTVADMMELMNGQFRMKYMSYVIAGENKGKNKTNKIMFDGSLIGKKMTEEQILSESFKLQKEKIKKGVNIYKINPEKFAKLKYTAYMDADNLMPKSEAFEKAWQLEGYDRMIQNPIIDLESVTRDFLLGLYSKGDPDKYMKKMQSAGIQQMMSAPNQNVSQQGLTQALMKNQTSRQNLSV